MCSQSGPAGGPNKFQARLRNKQARTIEQNMQKPITNIYCCVVFVLLREVDLPARRPFQQKGAQNLKIQSCCLYKIHRREAKQHTEILCMCQTASKANSTQKHRNKHNLKHPLNGRSESVVWISKTRHKEFLDTRIILEGSPSESHSSRLELLQGTVVPPGT